MAETARIYGARQGLTLCKSADDALNGADALVIVTEWQEFRRPDFEQIRKALTAPVIFDGRNLYDPKALAKQGFAHYAIGRGKTLPVQSP
jgi:UDPglucose 6-dehydrogenase